MLWGRCCPTVGLHSTRIFKADIMCQVPLFNRHYSMEDLCFLLFLTQCYWVFDSRILCPLLNRKHRHCEIKEKNGDFGFYNKHLGKPWTSRSDYYFCGGSMLLFSVLVICSEKVDGLTNPSSYVNFYFVSEFWFIDAKGLYFFIHNLKLSKRLNPNIGSPIVSLLEHREGGKSQDISK